MVTIGAAILIVGSLFWSGVVLYALLCVRPNEASLEAGRGLARIGSFLRRHGWLFWLLVLWFVVSAAERVFRIVHARHAYQAVWYAWLFVTGLASVVLLFRVRRWPMEQGGDARP